MSQKNQFWNLLLLEDDEEDYLILKDMLHRIERKDCSIFWTPNPEQALEQLETNEWDAVLVDYDLGKLNGLEFIREAISRGHGESFIVVTGRGSYELDLEAMEAGATDYISKLDLNPTLLERVVRHAIERRQNKDRLERLVAERTQELHTAFEELSVMNEELRAQNEAILMAKEGAASEIALYLERQRIFPTAFLITDAQGMITEGDFGAALLFGSAPEQLKGRLLVSFIALDDRSQFTRSFVHLDPRQPLQHWKFKLKPDAKKAFDCYFTAYHFDDGITEPVVRWLIHAIPSVG